MVRGVVASSLAGAMTVVGCGLLASPAPTSAAQVGGEVAASSVVGRSVAGREIVAIHRSGAGPTTTTLLVIGQMHGNEKAGLRVVDVLAEMQLPAGLDLWLVPTLNPDGYARNTRANARGVDLNRNFPRGWHPTAVSGRSRASEPETQAATDLLSQVKPDAVVSFHQALHGVDTSVAKTRRFAKLLARAMKLPRKVFRCSYGCHGTMTQWYNAKFRGVAVTVELNARPSSALIRRSATGAVSAAMALAAGKAGGAPNPGATPAPSASASPSAVDSPSAAATPSPADTPPAPTTPAPDPITATPQASTGAP